ncbi:MAG: hypothetical protein ACRD1B_08845 [Thermoanaerobaculia bacterium]
MRTIVLAVLVVLVAGCATSGNTPAQDLAWERWGACNHFNTIALDRVDQDGRLVVTAYQVDGTLFAACVETAAANQARRGAAVPQAVVLVKDYGCQGGAM